MERARQPGKAPMSPRPEMAGDYPGRYPRCPELSERARFH